MRSLLLAAHRVRTPVYLVAAVALLGGGLVIPSVAPGSRGALAPIATAGFFALLTTIVVIIVGGRFLPRPDAVTVTAPVTGRWLAVNSPETKVPSHGIHAYGQTFAIDLVHEPEDEDRPQPGSGTGMRPPQDYPAFGRPVRAMVDGQVVAAADGQRDHRSRSSTAAIVYMMLEGMVREIGGPRFIVGNHVTIRTPDGTYALVAHLRQGSVQVLVGDEVRAGEQIGECGNSGNTSEPHVHAQLMDRRSLMVARGLPMAFAGIVVEGGEGSDRALDGLPADEERMVAPSPASDRSPRT